MCNRTHLVILCCLLSVLVLVAAQDDDYDIPCPNDCSARGTCGLHGVCACVEGWTGADCSTESLLVPNGRTIASSVEENGEIATFHTFLTHLTAHLVLDVRRTTNLRVPLDIFISSRGSPSESQWSVRARMEADEDLVELVVKNGRNGEWFCGISFTSNANSTRLVGFSIAMNATNALDPSLVASPGGTPTTGTIPVGANQPAASDSPEVVIDTTTVAIVAGVLCSVIILILVGGIVAIFLLRAKMERMYLKLNEHEMR